MRCTHFYVLWIKFSTAWRLPCQSCQLKTWHFEFPSSYINQIVSPPPPRTICPNHWTMLFFFSFSLHIFFLLLSINSSSFFFFYFYFLFLLLLLLLTLPSSPSFNSPFFFFFFLSFFLCCFVFTMRVTSLLLFSSFFAVKIKWKRPKVVSQRETHCS